jgi:uncharacterized protein
MKSKKVILDTNLWISFLISKKFDAIDSLIDTGIIKLIFSEELIEEFLTVAKRGKFAKYFTDKDIDEVLRLFDRYGLLVRVESNIARCRDSKDNFLLNLAIDSKADYLLTGDADLLMLGKIKKTRITTFNDFFTDLKMSL